MTSSYTHIITSLGLKGLAAFFVTQTTLTTRHDEIMEDINVFPLLYQGKAMFQHIFLIRQKGRYLPRYTRDFQSMLAEHFAGIERKKVAHLVQS